MGADVHNVLPCEMALRLQISAVMNKRMVQRRDLAYVVAHGTTEGERVVHFFCLRLADL